MGGGLPGGALLLLRGDEGAGASELALCVLRAALRRGLGARAFFTTTIRSASRARHEASALFRDEKLAAAIAFRELRRGEDPLAADLRTGDVLVVESAAGLLRALPHDDLVEGARGLAERAHASQALVLLTQTRGTLATQDEALLGEACDGVLLLRWREGSTMRRRTLEIVKLSGFAPSGGDETPVFEVGVRPGAGFTVSQVTNVL